MKPLPFSNASSHASERLAGPHDARNLAGVTPWHTLPPGEALGRLQGTPEGLSTREANERLDAHGPNELKETQGNGLWAILWEQATSTMILILVVAGVLALAFKSGDGFPVDAVAIFSIVVLFVVLGALQEYRAQKAIAALKKMATPSVRVLRDGTFVTADARALVPGDVITLEAGQSVPADVRLLSVQSLKVQEAALTGESDPVEKVIGALAGEGLPVGDRKNMAYLGSAVTFGRGQALVVETGAHTELGRIATLLQTVEKVKTPLQKKLDRLGKALALLGLAVAVVVALIGVYVEGQSWASVLVLAISIAVAVVPEGLPAVLTFTLALGGQRMLKRKALVRKLPAVETLGSVTTICSDKTGTLTQNHMTVQRIADARARIVAQGDFSAEGDALEQARMVFTGFALCNDVVRQKDGECTALVGDPTEVALVEAAALARQDKESLDRAWPRIAEVPFDSERKLMTTVHALGRDLGVHRRDAAKAFPAWGELAARSPALAFTKGAIEQVLARCTHVWEDGRVVPIEDEMRARCEGLAARWADAGERVLALAARGVSESELTSAKETSSASAFLESDLTFLGLCAMLDPARPEAKAAVATCQRAGIRVVMITGDHPATATAIARELGICGPADTALTGPQLAGLDATALRSAVLSTKVYARVSPEQKLRIVEALQAQGQVVAMTGDGVNDAPALRKADIGVAMGTGTDVAKEAADIVLLDDNFATIVSAVEEGRTVYDNLRRFVMFSLSGNIAKVILVAVAPLIGLKAVLTPIQILFSNLLTDGLLGLGMGLERHERDIMDRPPYAPGESIFARGVGAHVAVVGPLIAAVLLGLAWILWPGEQSPGGLVLWGTTMFTALAFVQLARALSARSFTLSAFKTGVSGNPFLFAMIGIALVLQLASVFLAPFHPFFETTALPPERLALCVGVAAALFLAMEVVKKVMARAHA